MGWWLTSTVKLKSYICICFFPRTQAYHLTTQRPINYNIMQTEWWVMFGAYDINNKTEEFCSDTHLSFTIAEWHCEHSQHYERQKWTCSTHCLGLIYSSQAITKQHNKNKYQIYLQILIIIHENIMNSPTSTLFIYIRTYLYIPMLQNHKFTIGSCSI